LGNIGDTHAQASNLHNGYDNWLYGSVGYSGFDGTVGGGLSFKMGTYRFRPDGSALEFLHQFTNNTWAHSYNDAGDQFGGTANGAPIFFGGIPDSAKAEGMQLMTAKKINVIDPCHPITRTSARSMSSAVNTAAAGSAFVYSKALPVRFQGKALVCEPTMKLVAVQDVRPDGAGYTALDGMNLFASSDEWTSPVYAEVGPDGAVWIADFHNFIIQHNPTPTEERGGFKGTTGVGGAHENSLRDHSRGRIYRVIGKDAKSERKSLAGATTAQLVSALNDDVQYWRLLAQQKIVEGRTDATESLQALVAANDGKVGAVHALWALHGLGTLDSAIHRTALLAKDARLRRNAVRALGADEASSSLFFGAGVVSDPDPATRLAAFVKLAMLPTTPEIQTLVKQLGADQKIQSDEWFKEAARLLAKRHKVELYRDGPNLLVNGDLEKLEPMDCPMAGSAVTTAAQARRPGTRAQSGPSSPMKKPPTEERMPSVASPVRRLTPASFRRFRSSQTPPTA